MEEFLNKISELNETLISEKVEIRKKLFEKYINSSEDINTEDTCFFYDISRKMKDKEYENLRIKYEKIKNLLYYINQLDKKED